MITYLANVFSFRYLLTYDRFLVPAGREEKIWACGYQLTQQAWFTSNLIDIPGIIARTPTKDSVGSPRDMAFATVLHLHSMQSSYSQHKRISKYICAEACVTTNCSQRKGAHSLHPHIRIRPQTGLAYYWKVCSLPTVRFWICQQPVCHSRVVRNERDTCTYTANIE